MVEIMRIKEDEKKREVRRQEKDSSRKGREVRKARQEAFPTAYCLLFDHPRFR